MIKNNKNIKSFTLIEVLVSIVIFTIAIAGLAVIFLSIVQTQTKILQTQYIMSQASYVVEYMGNALRLAIKDTAGACTGIVNRDYNPADQPSASSTITFLNYDGKCRQFLLSGAVIQERVSTNGSSGSLGAAIDLTSSKVIVESLAFLAKGDIAPYQPKVTVMVKMEPVSTLANPPQLTIQTTLSQRQLNIAL